MEKIDYKKEALKIHEEYKGKLEIKSVVPINDKETLSTLYTPGVAEPCLKIAENKEDIYKYTMKTRLCAVITDGSAVLGLGNIGAKASIPVMEGKCALFKEFGGIDSIPIAIETQEVDKFVETVIQIHSTFGAINLEDISAPRCFEIEKKLDEALDIPVFHDDQHGTAVVVLAGLINALKITEKQKEEIKIVVNGVGAAGTAIIKLLHKYGVKQIIAVDSTGIIHTDREKNMNTIKNEIAEITGQIKGGTLLDSLKDADVFVGVSKPNILGEKEIAEMKDNPIIFALSNPNPEIDYDLAKKLGVKILATGRSDYPNQINNVLAFPGIIKGALQNRVKKITDEMKINAAKVIANMVESPTEEEIIPNPFRREIAEEVSKVIIER